ncbi:hypothetical protein [Kocuria soli]|nr:hypothetical protein [Kocuria soli]
MNDRDTPTVHELVSSQLNDPGVDLSSVHFIDQPEADITLDPKALQA